LSLICLPYAVFGSVIWAAYGQFGEQSLLDRAPLVVADRAPLKLIPSLRPRDRLVPEGEVGLVERRLPGPGQATLIASSHQAERPELGALQFGMRAHVGSLSPRPADGSFAGPEEMPPNVSAEVAPAPLAEAREPAAASRTPPRPSFKPIASIRTAAAPRRERAVDAQVEIAPAPPPTPALKPIVMPASELDRRPYDGARAVAGADDSPPEGLQAWWANFKILLASGATQPTGHAGGDDSGDQAAQRVAARADAGGDGRNEGRGGARGGDRDRGGGANDGGTGGGGGANDGGTGGGGSADDGADDGGGSRAGGDDGGTGGGSADGGTGDGGGSGSVGNDGGTNGRTGTGGSSAGGGSAGGGGIHGGGGGTGGRVGDSIGGIADGIGGGIGDGVGRGGGPSRGDGDRGGRGGGRGAQGDDRGGRDAGRGDRGGRDGGGRGR